VKATDKAVEVQGGILEMIITISQTKNSGKIIKIVRNFTWL